MEAPGANGSSGTTYFQFYSRCSHTKLDRERKRLVLCQKQFDEGVQYGKWKGSMNDKLKYRQVNITNTKKRGGPAAKNADVLNITSAYHGCAFPLSHTPPDV